MKTLKPIRGMMSFVTAFGILCVGLVEMVSGQGAVPCCKDCKNYKFEFAECFHTAPFPKPPIPCDATKCIHNILDQNACEPGGAKSECKTKADPAKRAAGYQTVYTGLTNCPFGTDTGITVIYRYFNTDLADNENCAFYTIGKVSCRGTLTVGACTAGNKDDVLKDLPRGTRYLCD